MMREHRPGAESAIGSASSSSANLDPGKRTLTDLAGPDAIASAASHSNELKKLQGEAHDAYVGANHFFQKGILDHKLDAVTDMQTYLIQKDDKPESITGFLLEAALALTIPVGAAELAAAVEAGELGAALIDGGGDVLGKLPGVFLGGGGDGKLPLDPVAFCSNFKSALRLGWPQSVKKLTSRMTTMPAAHRIRDAAVKLANQPATVKKSQYAEVLDAWVNALKSKTQGGPVAGMGKDDFRGATMGRLHISGVTMTPPRDGKGKTTFQVDHLSAKLDGVPEDARNLLLGRTIGHVQVARTITGFGVVLASGRLPPPPSNFAFGVLPDSKLDLHDDDVTPIAKDQLAGIGGSWQNGLSVIWNAIKDRSMSSLGITGIGG